MLSGDWLRSALAEFWLPFEFGLALAAAGIPVATGVVEEEDTPVVEDEEVTAEALFEERCNWDTDPAAPVGDFDEAFSSA